VECCGLIPFKQEEFEKHRDKAERIEDVVYEKGYVGAITTDGFCTFVDLEKKKCKIYEDRPDKCRAFGVVPALPCKYIDENGEPSSRQRRRRVERQYAKNLDKFKKIREVVV